MMFATQAARIKEEVATVAICAQFSSEFRRIRIASGERLPQLNPYENIPTPSRAEWAVFDHCSGITRLYAIYERFVADLITAWLKYLPNLFPAYQTLPDALRKQHVRGVAHVLPRLGDRRYQHLTASQVIEGLYLGHKKGGEYELLYELFEITERNLRLDALGQLFSHAAINDIKAWLEHHGELQSFMAATYGGQETVDSKLNSLVSYRNEAAHGEDVGQVLGLSEFLDLVAFIEKLCFALTECVFHGACRYHIENSTMTILGRVSEVFEKPNAVVAIVKDGDLTVGQEVIVINNFSCRQSKILNLQLDGTTIDTVVTTGPKEVGIKFDSLPVKGSEIVVQQPLPENNLGAFI